MQTSNSAIITRSLTKRFGDFTAVAGIDLDVRRGEIFGLLGPNGSGKTTTIRMILGLLRPTAGTVEVLGVPMAEHPERIRPRVGYMSQRFSLYNDLTVLQNLQFYGRAYGLENDLLKERIQDAIHRAGLEGHERTRTKDLSGGWRQRLALRAAILHRPALLFLDEPTAGIDPVSRRAFWNLLYKLVAEEVTVFVTTHYMDEAELCQRVGFLSQGRLVALDTPDRLKVTQMRGQVLEISTPDPDRAMRVLKEAQASGRLPFDEVAFYGAQIHAVVPDAEAFKQPITALLENEGISVSSIEWIAPTLEDVFISSVRQPGE